MKKLLISMAIVAFLIACGGSDSSGGDGKNPPPKNGTSNGTNNGNQNGTNNGSNNQSAPCDKPKADDGSQPQPLPVC